mgnify:CR=1 FL=1
MPHTTTTASSARATVRDWGALHERLSRMYRPVYPDLPTLDEAGLKGYELIAWFAAYAPAKTPKPVIDALNAAMRKALADPEVAPKLLAAGIEPVASSPDELKTFMISEIEKWRKIAADAKIEPE